MEGRVHVRGVWLLTVSRYALNVWKQNLTGDFVLKGWGTVTVQVKLRVHLDWHS